MELRKKFARLKYVTQIPHYDSLITRDGDKIITREGDLITWIRIVSAYATDVVYDGASYSFIEHYVLSNGTEAAARKIYNRFSPVVTITSTSTTEVVTPNPTSWSSSIISAINLGEELYENYEGWHMYINKYDISAEYVNEGNIYGVTALAETASRMIYHDQFLTVNFTAATPTFSSSYTQNYIANTQVYNTNFIVSVVSGSLTASDSYNVAVYMQTAISDFPTEWGKLLNVQHTVTPNEDRSSWTYIVALTFENRFLPIRVYRNGNVVVDTNSSVPYQADLNCAVYADWTAWVASRAIDSPQNSVMIWYNAAGVAKRTLDYITATAQGWNDGHNTIQNFATTSNISNNVLNVYLWGNLIASYRVLT